ncbi:hypothetical protein HAX54_035109 [Datura stramonium]|uniref:Uncharacterized protein n=1 Tax=Datura stramonium TaxID=4076 RepID=A0ABS8SF08_DATST|nr:hypothetical protein [Datura stramonium]
MVLVLSQNLTVVTVKETIIIKGRGGEELKAFRLPNLFKSDIDFVKMYGVIGCDPLVVAGVERPALRILHCKHSRSGYFIYVASLPKSCVAVLLGCDVQCKNGMDPFHHTDSL